MSIPRPANDAGVQTVQLSTPLAVLGMFISVIRERFKEGNFSDPARPWYWTAVPAETGVFIESGWNENLEARTTRPGVWVDCLQNVYRASGVGRSDQVSEILQHTHARHHSFAESDITIDCTARKRGESMLLGSMVQDFIQASTPLIARFYGLRQISDTLLDRTVKFDKDDTLWNSHVSFRAFYEVRWGTIEIPRILHQVIATVTASGDPVESFLETAVRQEFDPPE
jgi:hypothetical protein